MAISHLPRVPLPSRFPVGSALASPPRAAPPRAVLAEDDPWARLRAAAAVALAGSGLVLGPALWLGLAVWAWSGGLALLALPLGVLGLSAALVAGFLAARRTLGGASDDPDPSRAPARIGAGVGEVWGRRTPLARA